MRKRILVASVLTMMPLLAIAYSDLEIANLIDEKINGHYNASMLVVSIFLVGLGGALTWLFHLVNTNRKTVINLEELRHAEHIEILSKMEENCSHVDDKLNKHTLYVAQNYVRDEKIEKMLERTIKPLQDQLNSIQLMMNNHFARSNRHGDSE